MHLYLAESVQPALLKALDVNNDQKLSRDEFVGGFGKWFAIWTVGGGDALTEDRVREGLNAVLPFRFGRPPRGDARCLDGERPGSPQM